MGIYLESPGRIILMFKKREQPNVVGPIDKWYVTRIPNRPQHRNTGNCKRQNKPLVVL
jgi:hypothetical protein